MPQEIHVDIASDGEVRIDAVGFIGPDCERATKFLEDALGQITHSQKKPEYHQRNHLQRRQQIGGQRR